MREGMKRMKEGKRGSEGKQKMDEGESVRMRKLV